VGVHLEHCLAGCLVFARLDIGAQVPVLTVIRDDKDFLAILDFE
jgi:hypothetical protein